MGYFPMCLELSGREVLLVGSGAQIAHKAEKLKPFGAALRISAQFNTDDLTEKTAFVVVGDTGPAEAARIRDICKERRIPVNVVDDPALSDFFFPAMATRGELTISVSTGGSCPGGAAYLARQIEESLPVRTEEILDWLQKVRERLYQTHPRQEAAVRIRRITARAFELGRPLTDAEME